MKLLLMIIPALLSAQTLTFTPETVATKNGQLTLWAVSANMPGRMYITAGSIYEAAATYKIGHVDPETALTILTTKVRGSTLARVSMWFGIAATVCGVGDIVAAKGLATEGTNQKIQAGAAIGAAAGVVVKGALDSAVPPLPRLPANILGTEITLTNGSGAAQFYSLPSTIGTFTVRMQ